MIRLLIVMLFLGSFTVSFGQKDKLFLIDNGYLKGKIIGASPSKLLFILNGQDTLSMKLNAVKSAALKRPYSIDHQSLEVIDSINNLNNNIVNYSFSVGGIFDDSNGSNSFRASLSTAAVYIIKSYLQLGLGIDWQQYTSFDALPLYFLYQGDFSPHGEKGLFYYGGIGKSIAWKKSECACYFEEVTGKRMIKAGLGYRWKIESLKMSVRAGWIQQRIRATGGGFFGIEGSTIFKQSLNGMEMKIGLTF